MDIRRLEAFAKVYELKSFSRAGQEMYLSQPTISTHVSSLEHDLGVTLFDRLGRTILPTQAADVLYGYSRKIFESIEGARAELAALQERVAGDLLLGGSTIPAHYLLPELMAGFSREYPDVTVHLSAGDSEEIVERVAEGELICGLVGALSERQELEFVPLYEDEMVIVAAPGTADDGGRKVSAARLAEHPWINREVGSGTRRAFENAVEQAGLDFRSLRTVMTVEGTQAAIQFARAGMGLTATSRLAAAEHLASGELVAVEVEGLSFERWFYLVHHRRRHFFPAVRSFIDYLKRRAERGF
jgi:DNA-binding transcriptional LysR family regulator